MKPNLRLVRNDFECPLCLHCGFKFEEGLIQGFCLDCFIGQIEEEILV